LCSDFTDDWSVSFTIGDSGEQQIFTVTGSRLALPGYVDDDYCFPPFNSWDSHNVIVGALWMRNFYSVFDFGAFQQQDYQMQMGFAPLKEEYLPKA
jgi:saccharopepsin